MTVPGASSPPDIWRCQDLGKGVVVAVCFHLYPPDDTWHGASFDLLICHVSVSFGEVSVKVFAHFLLVFLLWSVKNSLRVLDNGSLTDVSSFSGFIEKYIHIWYAEGAQRLVWFTVLWNDHNRISEPSSSHVGTLPCLLPRFSASPWLIFSFSSQLMYL